MSDIGIMFRIVIYVIIMLHIGIMSDIIDCFVDIKEFSLCYALFIGNLANFSDFNAYFKAFRINSRVCCFHNALLAQIRLDL